MRRLLFIACLLIGPNAYALNLISSATWTEEGGFKMPQQDQLPYGNCSTCTISRIWDGTTIKLFGAKGELLTWVTYLNAGASDATEVTVTLSSVTGLGSAAGSGFSSVAVSSMNVWDYTNRPTALYKYGYLQIIGSHNGPGAWDPSEYEERQLPPRFRVPCTGTAPCAPTSVTNLWNNRQDHDKFYPDIAIPMELFHSSFTVYKTSSQAIGGEIYISTDMVAGTYTATLKVFEGAALSTAIPIQILVYNATIPAKPAIPVLAYVAVADIGGRYYGDRFPSDYWTDPNLTTELRTAAFLHRHKIIAIGDRPASTTQYPSAGYSKHQDGSAYKEAYGLSYNSSPDYGGGDTIHMIGIYGTWKTANWSSTVADGASGFCTNLSSWTYNCNQRGLTCYLYTGNDEASDTILATTVSKYSALAATATTCASGGNRIGIFQTGHLPNVISSAPYVSTIVSASWLGVSSTTWASDEAISSYTTAGYNSGIGVGSMFELQESGAAHREVMWGAWKTHQKFWFLWQANYHNDSNNPGQSANGYNANAQNENDMFRLAKNFGYDTYTTTSTSKGHVGFGFNNGDGNLLYYSSDQVDTPNYTVNGVFGSYRLNQFTRSIQDAQIIGMAYAINPSSATDIVNTVISDVMYLRQCQTLVDCTYVYGDRPWTEDRNKYEAAREAMLMIAEDNQLTTGKVQIKGSVQIKAAVTIR